MTYEEALEYISALQHRGWRLGLDRMDEFVRRAGLERSISGQGPSFIHVAGTNGKGSVTAYLQFILREAGYRTGGFFSPFVYDIRERIQLDGELISKEDLVRLTEGLIPISEELEKTELGGVTEFEFKTAMGFALWEERNIDWVALEVGLGGRLDATNVVTPACTVITSIGLDHTEFLGETYSAIAGEKAGIFKPGVPAVVGELDEESLEVVRARADELGCPLYEYSRDFSAEPEEYEPESFDVRLPSRTIENLSCPIPGVFQPHNIAVALAALDAAGLSIDPDVIRGGLAKVQLSGRMERREVLGRTLILDGAHNAEAMGGLMMSLLKHNIKRSVAVFGMLQGHDPQAVCWLLDNAAAEVHLCPIDFRRTADPKELARHFRSTSLLKRRVFIHESSSSAIQSALESAGNRPILVTGSFYLVGEVGRYLDSLHSAPISVQ